MRTPVLRVETWGEWAWFLIGVFIGSMIAQAIVQMVTQG
jgi:hypothetical protein